MADSNTVIVKAVGLQTSPNELSRPDGALIEASNVIIKRDNIVEQRRGFDLFGNALPDIAARVKQLTTYRNRLLRHYLNKLQFDSNGSGNFVDFAGNFMETEEGLRMKFVESNGNFYFTTADGIKKISARNPGDFTTSEGYIVNSGGIKAVDLTGRVVYTPNSQSAWFPQDSAVAYRAVWAYKDLNTNLIQGAPSQRLVVNNPMIDLLLQDYMRVLSTLDNLQNPSLTSARINDKNYVSTLGVNLTTSASQLRSSLVALASKLDNDILFADMAAVAPLQMNGDSASVDAGVGKITFITGDPTDYLSPGSKIFLSGFFMTARTGIQKIQFDLIPTAGDWKVSYEGNETTSLAYNISAGALQTALQAVTGLSAVSVFGDFTSGFTVTFPAAMGAASMLEISSNSLTSSSAPVFPFVTYVRPGIATPSGDINGAQEVVSVDSTSITFNTTAVGGVSFSSATINSNTYREITPPDEISLIATNDELVSMQTFISDVILGLFDEPDAVIDPVDKPAVEDLDVTTTATTEITVTIPEGITTNYFLQVYRSSIAQATGAATFDDVTPSDELQLVYEAYPTEAELIDGFMTFIDITPDVFRGANLYTNAATGEGILSANDIPPFAKDINRYRNCVFYANTKTRQRMDLNLLGVTRMVENYDPANPPQLVISDGETSTTYTFIIGVKEKYTIETLENLSDSLNGKYFLFSTLIGDYYVWFDSDSAVDPAIPNRTGIRVVLASNATDDEVAIAVYNALVVKIAELEISISSNILTIENTNVGYCTPASAGDSGFTVTQISSGKGESVQEQKTEITAVAGADYTTIGAADYFTINNTFNSTRYVLWFNTGLVTPPSIMGSFPIEIFVSGIETASEMAQKIADALSETEDFICEVNGSSLIASTFLAGNTTDSTESVADAGFTVTTLQPGRLEVLLSNLDSPARAVDETARSFVRVINKNRGDIIYAYYLSSVFDVPGKMNLEARNLAGAKFYVLANSVDMGVSFQPDAGPEFSITSITSGLNPVVTLAENHRMITGDQVVLSGTDTNPLLNGLYTVNVISPNSFSIEGVYLVSGGSRGVAIRASESLYSENEERGNRVYYSKFHQPEAVPIVNYFDIGAQDKDILRIIPLRDSMFVFKEDGLYRISGESAPFQLELFDNSFNLLAPDSAAVCNNVIYSWTTQGIQSLTESGSSIISRAIDNTILKTQSSNYLNFKTATWGIGYESDNSYIVFTTKNMEDSAATIAYRFSTLTNSWTTFDLSKQAGVINPADDKMYLAPLDVAFIEQERKTFSRLDYADRRLDSFIAAGNLINNKLIIPVVSNLQPGDVVVQDQTITVTQFNILLRKLDLDPASESNYLSTLALSKGMSPRNQLVALCQKLDSDPGIIYSNFETDIESHFGTVDGTTEQENTIIYSPNHGLISGRVVSILNSTTSPSIDGNYEVTVIDADHFSIPTRVFIAGVGGIWQTVNTDFRDLKTCYNKTIQSLNSDASLAFNNYSQITNNTLMEAIITNINYVTKVITLNLNLDFLVGDLDIYKAFESRLVYSPITMGDPLMHKQIREATLMFETRTLTSGTMSFYTDLLPEFQDINFNLDGNGIFGHVENFGDGYFGGFSNSAPFRTYVPRQCQRCRYIVVKFAHKVAREDYRLNGMTLTGRTQLSSRAFR